MEQMVKREQKDTEARWHSTMSQPSASDDRSEQEHEQMSVNASGSEHWRFVLDMSNAICGTG